ncbi:MAG: DUF3540 domain-containing protein [Granulosicoccus sp.]
MEILKTNQTGDFANAAPVPATMGMLCEGTVRLVTGGRVLIQTDQENVWATLALAYPVQLSSGDRVLTIGEGQSWYLVGVLQTSNSHTIYFEGDLELQASGSLKLSGLQGVSVKGPSIGFCAERINIVADTLSERFRSVRRVVKEGVFQRIGKLRTTIKGSYRIKADRIVQRAERDVSIDGRKINLG